MYFYPVVFLLISLVAAALGFGGAAGMPARLARILFVLFMVLFVVSLVAGRGIFS